MFFLRNIFISALLGISVFSLTAQTKFPKEFEQRMKKFRVRFERNSVTSLLSANPDTTLLQGFSAFNPKKRDLNSRFVMFKNPAKKLNVAYYVDTCNNHYNLEAEVRNDMAVLFNIKDEKKYGIENQNAWKVLLNADEVIMAGLKSSDNSLKPFIDYKNTLLTCYFNNVTKGKIYVIVNFEEEINKWQNDFMKVLMEFSFTPHEPSPGLQPELIIQTGSNDEIDAIAVSNSGKLLAYGGLQGHIKIASGDGSREFRTIKAHNKQILSIKFSDNERLVVSCSVDSTIKLWDVETGKLVTEFRGHKDRVNDIVFFDRNRKLLSSSSDSTLKIWNIAEKKCFKTVNKFKNKTAQIELYANGKKAIINLLKGNIMLLDLETFKDTILKSGFERITDFAMPYSNAIAVSNGKAVKFIFTDSKNERTISTEGDSAYSRMVVIKMNDTANNVRLLLLTDNGYGKLYDYNDHAFKKTIQHSNYNTLKYYSLGFNYKYNMAIYGGVTFCTTYNLNTDEFTFIEGTGLIPMGVETDKQNEVVAVNYSNAGSIFSLRSGRIIWNSNAAACRVRGLSKINKSNGNLAFLSPDSLLCSYDYQNNKIVYQFKPKSVPVYFQPLLNDSSFLYLTKDKEVILHHQRKDVSIAQAYTLKELNLLRDSFLLCQEKENACLKNIFDNKVTVLGQYNLHTWFDALEQNSEYFAIRTKDTAIYFFNKQTFEKVNELTDGKLVGEILYFSMNPVKNEMAAVCNDYEVKAIDLEKKQLVKRWRPNVGYLWKAKYTADGKFLVTAGTDAFIKLWETKFFSNVTSTYSAAYGSYITLTPQNYYVASSSFTKESNPNLAYYSYGNTAFDLADLDLEFNRPDIISEALGYESAEIISAYKKLHEKRLKRLHLESSSKLNTGNRPILRSVFTYPPEVTKSDLQLFFMLHDDYKKLKNIKITINNVPVFGVEGTQVIDGFDLTKTSSMPIANTIHLSKGWNKVSVKITNEDNVESYPYTFSTWYSNAENKTKPKLHIIGIGVSKFKDDKYNLKYPAKDVRDIIKLFQNQKNIYSRIIVDTLLNDSATLKNILKLKEKIKNDHQNDSIGVNDKVMIFAATHGVLDKNLDYYLATYDMNFENPSENGLLYSEIENILDHISPRNKIVLIDACHSGEIDKDEIVVTKKDPVVESGAIAFRSASSSKISSSEGIMKNSLNLMKEMFIDLRKTSGATVISSAGGTEYAIEGEEWNNGVFSYSMINALRKHKADINNDNKVYLSELQKYIEADVPRITQGKQQPTSRSENISNDVLIWRNDFNEELAGAIKINDKELTDKLIKDGADVTSVDSNGATTLMWAALYSDLDLVKKLVERKADVRAKGIIYFNAEKTAYYGCLMNIAAGKNKLDLMKYLIEEKKINVDDCGLQKETKTEIGWPALMFSVFQENEEAVTYLLSKGANVNLIAGLDKNNAGSVAFSRSNPEICKKLIAAGLNLQHADSSGNTIVMNSIYSSNIEVMKLAVKKYKEAVNIPSQGNWYPVHSAVYGLKKEQFRLLVKNGAKLNVESEAGFNIFNLAVLTKDIEMVKEVYGLCPELLNKKSKSGQTPLLMVSIDKNPEIAKYLIDLGADLSLKDTSGNSILSQSIIPANIEIMKLVLSKYKEGVNIPTTGNWYPVHTAVYNSKKEQFRLLVKNGAKLNVVSGAGFTILHLAVLSKDVEMLKEVLVLCPELLNERNKNGRTALVSAVIDKNAEMCEFLCSKGADISVKDNDGDTFESLAKYYNDEKLIEIAKKYAK